jgi:hypothetical protein
LARALLYQSNIMSSQKVKMDDTPPLRWVSWEQHGDAEHDPDSRPVAWPPPPEVLAFWETGSGGGDGVDAYCTVVALVSAASAHTALAIIKKAWSPGIGAWRFNREYDSRRPPGDRFPPPKWARKLKRWPWKKDSHD